MGAGWEQITGISSTGRTTVIQLKMNQTRIVKAHRIWIIVGVHPPK